MLSQECSLMATNPNNNQKSNVQVHPQLPYPPSASPVGYTHPVLHADLVDLGVTPQYIHPSCHNDSVQRNQDGKQPHKSIIQVEVNALSSVSRLDLPRVQAAVDSRALLCKLKQHLECTEHDHCFCYVNPTTGSHKALDLLTLVIWARKMVMVFKDGLICNYSCIIPNR